KFKLLKQEESLMRAQWYAIQWRTLDSSLVQHTLRVQQQTTALEERHAAKSDTTRQLDAQRDAEHTANQNTHDAQRVYDAEGREIARIEQEIQHQTGRRREWEMDLQQVQQTSSGIREKLKETDASLQSLLHNLQTLEPELLATQHTLQTQSGQVDDTEKQ